MFRAAAAASPSSKDLPRPGLPSTSSVPLRPCFACSSRLVTACSSRSRPRIADTSFPQVWPASEQPLTAALVTLSYAAVTEGRRDRCYAPPAPGRLRAAGGGGAALRRHGES